MNKNLKLFLGISYIIILFAFLYLIFSYIEITRLNDFLYYKELQNYLENTISHNLYINLLIFFIFCLIWVSLLGFGSPLINYFRDFIWKMGWNFYISFIISIGALILYSIANFF